MARGSLNPVIRRRPDIQDNDCRLEGGYPRFDASATRKHRQVFFGTVFQSASRPSFEDRPSSLHKNSANALTSGQHENHHGKTRTLWIQHFVSLGFLLRDTSWGAGNRIGLAVDLPRLGSIPIQPQVNPVTLSLRELSAVAHGCL